MKILIVTQWFDPEPTFKGLVFAKALAAKGHDVEVITGFPNYPGGKLYQGYKMRFHTLEVIQGIKVHRVPLYPSHDGSAIKRVFNYASFAMSSLLCGLFNVEKPDIIYAYHPPLTTTMSASIISFFRRVPLVIDIQDLWPDTLAATGMLNNAKALTFVGKLCQLVYKKAAHIVVLSPGFRKRLIQRSVPDEKISVIYNWCDEEALSLPIQKIDNFPDKPGFNVVFAGNLGFAQGLPAIIEAAKILQDRGVNANLILLGDGVAKENAIDQSHKNGLKNVFFLPRVGMSEVGSYLQRADALLVHLTDNELFSITIPSRTQAYLAVGKPILMGVNGDASDIIRQADAGITFKANDGLSMANAVAELVSLDSTELDRLGKNAQSFYQSEMALNVGVDHFIKLFDRILYEKSI